MSDDPVRRLILILGGARSGKSAYAEALAAGVARERIGPLRGHRDRQR